MEWLNYHHLYYFWTVVRKGSIVAACETLRLSPSTVSAQLHQLEESLDQKLLVRSGRTLVPTDAGKIVDSYAEDIFSLGHELLDTIKKDRPTKPLRLSVGIVDALPKLVAHWLMEPALRLPQRVRLICREGSPTRLLAQLATNDLDVVLSDAPAMSGSRVRAYNHLIAESGVSFIATPKLCMRHKRDFPRSLDGAPMLLPADNTSLRNELDQWFEKLGVRPLVMGEFEDNAMLRAFAESGEGIVPVASCVERNFIQKSKLRRIGRTNAVEVRFYAISTEKKLKHPPVVAICGGARRRLAA